MKLKINGEEEEVAAQTVAQLLPEMNAPEIGVAVARNGAVVRRAEHASTLLKENDEIEIIRAVQGGAI